MRQLRGVLLAALVLLAVLTPAVRAQEQPPLEDVVLRGRILRPDGSPLANAPVRVDTDSGIPFFNFFVFAFSYGTSLITCFERSAENDLCPIPSNKSFFTTTDGNGRYSFTFPKAKRQGRQTNTDYFLSVPMPSSSAGGKIVVAQYELELLTPVHNAPDLVMWDPVAKVKAGTRTYSLDYRGRPTSLNSVRVFVGENDVNLTSSKDDRTVEARDIEDATVNLVPYAQKDERAEGTIYHQRFTAVPVPLRGALVALSRGAPCTVVRKDGARSAACGFTDGDVINPGVTDPNPCQYDMNGNPYVSQDIRTGERTPCQAPITEVTVDLRAPKRVGEVRARGCGGCTVETSADGATWTPVPLTTTFAPRPVRYVRVKGGSLGYVPEISVWPPWPNEVATTPLADSTTVPTTPLKTSDHVAAPRTQPADSFPWRIVITLLVLLATFVFGASRKWVESRRR